MIAKTLNHLADVFCFITIHLSFMETMVCVSLCQCSIIQLPRTLHMRKCSSLVDFYWVSLSDSSFFCCWSFHSLINIFHILVIGHSKSLLKHYFISHVLFGTHFKVTIASSFRQLTKCCPWCVAYLLLLQVESWFMVFYVIA